MAQMIDTIHCPAPVTVESQETPATTYFLPTLELPKVSIVIPTLNEEKNLPHVLPGIQSWVHEVVLVDGHSVDRTIEVAKELYPDIHIIQQPGRGKGDALRAGFNAATGDIIVMIDADGSMDVGEIPNFIGALLSGADFVKGSRFLQGGGTDDMEVYRMVGNWFFTLLVRLLFGGRFSDLCYGYNAFWKDVVPKLALDADGFEIETMMNVRALRAGLNVFEVPSFESDRIHGASNLQTFPDGWRVLKTIFRERFMLQQISDLPEPPRTAVAPIPATGKLES